MNDLIKNKTIVSSTSAKVEHDTRRAMITAHLTACITYGKTMACSYQSIKNDILATYDRLGSKFPAANDHDLLKAAISELDKYFAVHQNKKDFIRDAVASEIDKLDTVDELIFESMFD